MSSKEFLARIKADAERYKRVCRRRASSPDSAIAHSAAFAAACAASLAAGAAAAQQLEPRAYANVPTGLNFLIGGYTYSEGGLATDPATPLQNAKLQIHAPFVAYARSFDAWRKSAKLDLVLATACLSGEAEANGVPVSRDVCGLLDPALRVTVNVFGAPALTLEEFRHYRQDLIVGVGLQVMAPFGQYDPDRLVNLGTNRWAFKPEIGLSKKLGALSVGSCARRHLLHDERRLLRRQDARAGSDRLDTAAPHLRISRRALARNQRHLLPRRAHHPRRREAERRAIDHAGRGDARAPGRPPSLGEAAREHGRVRPVWGRFHHRRRGVAVPLGRRILDRFAQAALASRIRR